MAATVTINETNGPSASSVETPNIANLNFGSNDSPNIDPATYPITAGDGVHSFEKWIRYYVSTLGGSSRVDNLQVWFSSLGGGYESGEYVKANLVTSGYSPATYPTGGPVNTASAVAVNAMPTSQPAGANIGIGGALSGGITVAPAYSDWIVMQLGCDHTTPPGNSNIKTITFQWDEQ